LAVQLRRKRWRPGWTSFGPPTAWRPDQAFGVGVREVQKDEVADNLEPFIRLLRKELGVAD
jgi:hypothetical protein